MSSTQKWSIGASPLPELRISTPRGERTEVQPAALTRVVVAQEGLHGPLHQAGALGLSRIVGGEGRDRCEERPEDGHGCRRAGSSPSFH